MKNRLIISIVYILLLFFSFVVYMVSSSIQLSIIFLSWLILLSVYGISKNAQTCEWITIDKHIFFKSIGYVIILLCIGLLSSFDYQKLELFDRVAILYAIILFVVGAYIKYYHD